jgi:hypothetical protein
VLPVECGKFKLTGNDVTLSYHKDESKH